MRRMFLTSSLLLALSASALAGQVYKWVDDKGVTHFGSQPPQGQQATAVSTTTAPPKPTAPKPAPEAKPTFESIADPEQAAINEKVKKEVAAQEAERRKQCDGLRTDLANLENNPRVRVESEGGFRRITEEERQQRIGDAQKDIAEHCMPK